MSHLHHKVSALIDDELSPSARARALAHARGCAACRQEIVETLDVKRRVNRLAPVEVSADLLDVVGSITGSTAVETAGPSPRAPRLRRVVVGVGSVSAALIAVAYVMGAPESSVAEPVSPSVGEFAAEFAGGSGQAPLSDPAIRDLNASVAERAATVLVPKALTAELPTSTGPGSTGSGSAGSGSAGSGAAGWGSAGSGDDQQLNVTRTRSHGGDDARAIRALAAALTAPSRVGYVGAFLIRSYLRDRVETVRFEVQHVPGQGTRFGVLPSGGPAPAESFVAEPHDATHAANVSLDALDAAYDLALDQPRRILGRSTTVVSATRDGQLCARFWIDDRTGVLLQRSLYADGRRVRQSVFTAFRPSRGGFMTHLPPEVAAPQTTRLSTDVAPVLNDRGWTCPALLDERFRLSQLTQLDTDGGVMRAEYTDGISRIAVYEERGALDPSALAGFRSVKVHGNQVYVEAGLPTLAVWESDGTVFTAVTDAPQQVVFDLISRLPHADAPPAPGVTARVRDGFSEMVSVVAP